MYAVIEAGGKQYRVCEGDMLRIEKLNAPVGTTVELEKVLLVERDGETRIGRPLVAGAKVAVKVLEHDKAKKIVVLKYKAKKNYRRKYGHRQPYTRVLVEKIDM